MTEPAPLLCCLLYQELEVCTTRFGYFLEQIIMISLADTFHVRMQAFALKLLSLGAKARECTALPSGAHLALHFKLLRSDLPPFCYELVSGLPVFFSSLLLQLLGNVLSSLPDQRTCCCSPLRAATEKGLAWWFPWTDQLSQKLFKWNISVKESLTGTELLLIDLLLRKHRRNMLNMKGKDLMLT